jgi:hypothetical protein
LACYGANNGMRNLTHGFEPGAIFAMLSDIEWCDYVIFVDVATASSSTEG